MDLADIRKHYSQRTLRRGDLVADPIEQFESWLAEAIEAEVLEPTAMSLSTVSKEGEPSVRTVLLKNVSSQGFCFFSHRESRKARDIRETGRAALLFYWRELERQVTISGHAEELSIEETQKYFNRRPRPSQIGAWASRQGGILKNREELEARYNQREKEFEGREVPMPEWWWGGRVIPSRIEFWQGGVHRLHDRFQYTLDENYSGIWRVERLSP